MRRIRQRRLSVTALVTGMVVWLLVGAAGHPAAAPWWPQPASSQARVVDETRIDQRMIDLKISSPALGHDAMVRLLVPRGWSKDADRTWPVLYLLHGCCEDKDYTSWTHFTDVEEFTADKDAIIVMPSAGRIGMYAKWWNWGLSDKPDWPKFHLTELRQILENQYRAGTDRSVAGLSMGAYGAMEYAAENPGMFGAAAAYSGALDLTRFPIPQFTQLNLIANGHFLWGALFGDPWSMLFRWEQHNPAGKVEELRGTRLYVSCGDGKPGPIEDPAYPGAVEEVPFEPEPGDNPDDPGWEASVLEEMSLENSKSFVSKLRAEGVPATVDFYSGGTHSWPYWERALKRSWSTLASGMGI
ncbi:alpha/beta hydrolase [Amycolatopsis aidingensis]|uniref:alpha/beta hydrolase n=1 Tax=Amycolatopsis aidingensis TaxID=2842453 RepID=UPI001C0D87AA|nr:alpha/beta hydrolase family protein [Amycolatopsis aidingensis]